MRPDKGTQLRQLRWNLTSHNLKPSAVTKIKEIEDKYIELGSLIINTTPQGREQSIALHDLETSKMYAVKSIALDPAEQSEDE